MKLNNKGFAISTIMYLILVIAIILIVSILAIFSSRRFILEKQKKEVLDDIYPSYEYILTYNNNGGSGCTSKGVYYGEKIGELCTPTKNGYNFIGWYNSDYTKEYTESTIYNEENDITVYALWDKIYPSVSIVNNNYLITPSEHSTKSREVCVTSDTECDSIRISDVSYNDSTGYLSLKATIYMNKYALTSAGQCSVRQVCIAKVGTTDCSIDLAQYDIDDNITGGWLAVGKSRVLFNGSVSLSSLGSGSYRIIAKNTDSTCTSNYKYHFTFTRDDTTRIPLLINVN